MTTLQDMTVLVTGAAGIGVGAGVCQAVHEAGGRVIVNDIDRSRAEAVVARYPGGVAAPGDVTEAGEVEAVFAAALDAAGRVDALVNNAGVGLAKFAADATEADFDRLHRLDMRGVWLVTRRYIRHRLDQGLPGAIVNVSSVHAEATMRRYAIYASAKAAVEGLTRGVAVEYGQHGIRCNAVAPGYVHAEQNYELIRAWTDDPEGWVRDHTTNHQAIPREIEPIDCGRAAVFLLSEAGRRITGQTLRVDAGMMCMLYNHDFV